MKQTLLLGCVLLAACSKPPPLEVIGLVPDTQLTAQSGAEFRTSSLAGQVWVANFIFTNCTGPCPRMTSQMRQVQDANARVKMVSFTVDPSNDTPEALAAYAQRFKVDTTRWTFLTGPQERLHQLCRNVFLLGNVDGQLNHSTRFVLVDKQSRIRAFYDSSEPDAIRHVLRDIERLEKE